MVFPFKSKLSQYQSLHHQRRHVDVIQESFKDSDILLRLELSERFHNNNKKISL